MKTETADIKIIKCGMAGNPVLFSKRHNICLHNDTKEQDNAEVEQFKKRLEIYQNHLIDNGLDNDTNSITYGDLTDFIDNHIQ